MQNIDKSVRLEKNELHKNSVVIVSHNNQRLEHTRLATFATAAVIVSAGLQDQGSSVAVSQTHSFFCSTFKT